MGIVKDWVDPVDRARSDHDEGLAERRQSAYFRRMLANLKSLHRCGIVVCDVNASQWVGGTLVDLSCAMTIPHPYGPEGGWRPSWTFASIAARDLWCFQTDVVDWWNDTDWSRYPSITPPRRKCRLRAYDIQERTRPSPLPLSSKDGVPEYPPEQPQGVYDRLRPRPRQYGPFLPLLNRHGMPHDLVEMPPYDSAKFNWRAARAAAGKRREPEEKTPAKASPLRRRVGKRTSR
jgi:hypothetical protein